MGNKNEQQLLPSYQNLNATEYDVSTIRPEEAEPRIEKSRRKILLATVLGALALAAPAEPAPPMQYVGVVENRIWSEDKKTSQEVARQVKDAGFNSIGLVVPYSPGQAEIKNDRIRICNAAQAADENGLKMSITIQGYDKDGTVGYAPHGYSDVTKFITTLSDYMWTLSGPTRCTKTPHNLDLVILNEPNTDTFWEAQFDAQGNWIAPKDYVQLLARVYPALKREANKLKVDTNVMAGGLTSGHNSLGFIGAMKNAKQQLGIKGRLFDIWTHHPYGSKWEESPFTLHPSGSFVGIADYKMLESALKSAFGYVPKIVYKEYAVETTIPAEKVSFYSGKNPEGINPVDEATQAKYYQEALGLTACQSNMKGLFFFHLYDDVDLGRWQTGLYYTDRTPKTSLGPVKQAIVAARAGTNVCGNLPSRPSSNTARAVPTTEG